MSTSDFDQLATTAARIAGRLKARGETLAIADGATGGLLSAAILTVPGATKFYIGGGVIYSRRAREVVLGIGMREAAGMRSVTEDYALLQARAVAGHLGAGWGLAESGSAGGSVHPGGVGSGQSWAAVAGPGGQAATRFTATASDLRQANMFAFAGAALGLLEEALG
jgi:PncC family amidohydrolase